MKGYLACALLCALISVQSVVWANQTSGDATHGQSGAADEKRTDHSFINFDGTQYALSFVDIKDKTTTNEYIPQGESLSDWTTLIGVRKFGSATELKEVLPSYVESIRPALVKKIDVLARDGIDPAQDVMLVILLVSPDKSYYEYNLHRFIRTPDGVVAYQFAERLPKKGNAADFTSVITRQASRIKELNDLKVAVQIEK